MAFRRPAAPASPQARRRSFAAKTPPENASKKSPTKPAMFRMSESRAALALKPDWQTRESLAIHLFDVPNDANAKLIYAAFKSEGTLYSIDLYEDYTGKRNGKGRVRFRPPPATNFWRRLRWQIELPDGRKTDIKISLVSEDRDNSIPSPVHPDQLYPAELEIPVSMLDFGPRTGPMAMLSMRRFKRSQNVYLRLHVDLRNRKLLVFFPVALHTTQKESSNQTIYSHFRLKVPFAQLTTLYQNRDDSTQSLSHMIHFDSPPIYDRHLHNVESTFDSLDAENSWREMDCWYRQTDIVHRYAAAGQDDRVRQAASDRLPISLRKRNPIIDIGRWNTIRITYDRDTIQSNEFKLLCNALRDFNLEIKESNEFQLAIPQIQPVPVIWDICDEPENSQTALHELIRDSFVGLPFAIRYQLEVCISHGYISEYNAASEVFVRRLRDMDESKALTLLEHVATEKKVYWDPMKIFGILFPRAATRRIIPNYCCMIHTATVTPSTIYWNTPSMEITNRVLRRYSEHSDRFLRVRFRDEKFEGRINSTNHNTIDEVFNRIKHTMTNGIKLGDRKYEFLAFGNSQFREHGAYFFASDAHVSAANIRAWMGEFSDIRNVAKYAARLGQCFSTTRAVHACRVHLERVPDVVRGGHTFSDGVGRISNFLAQMTQQELKIRTPDRDPPSAYQFRLGGCKGMLVLSAQARGREVHIRPSQEKFPATHQGLEIIRWSQFSMATLNRQLISVLSSLGVPDKAFHKKLRKMVSNLEEAAHDEKAAMRLLQKYVDPNQMTLVISQIVSDGFLVSKDPFVTSILTLWKAWQIKYLKEKAKIVIDRGACVLGVMDETATLQGFSYAKARAQHSSLEDKLAALPEIFIQVYRADEKEYKVIEGVCLLARNPSLHPGDIRVVRAVNRAELTHLKDVVVLPQLGDRDVASMCSGGDLDGDDYLVIWDEDLLPSEWFRLPMDYTPIKGFTLDRPVTVNDITTFFVNYMKNDTLPKIAHAHVAWTDFLPKGVEEAKCIRLAQLHSNAVDYNKTGEPAYLPRELRPRKWPHFMEKNYKPKDQIYHSKKILGQLYDAVDRVDFHPDFEMPFDKRVLECGIAIDEETRNFAKELKISYDVALRRIMAQHEIHTEFEVWTTFVLSHSDQSKDYKFHEELGRMSESLRDRFRGECYNKVGGRDFKQIAPLAVAIYSITNDEVVTALTEFRKKNPNVTSKPKPDGFPLISFAWLFPDILGRVALRYFDERKEEAVSRGEKINIVSDIKLQEGEVVSRSSFCSDMPLIDLSFPPSPPDTDTFTETKSLEGIFEAIDEETGAEIIEEKVQIMPSAIDILEDMLLDSDSDEQDSA
ncbi:hypothetical protein UA08_01933 [Talaromyces atroroseus]|uniref:RNA-dependent RNA polymerase n=1 Tax=Talaromyces atroroseus TaxID=1441469 RepID=A0A1Q5QAS7_TALAT|nr:hypothetical protein UA08_01933 [Talaromyces atroroseus]OKL63034.1 hypothetical protein UA08_01933 [Talaromyces atroroseus]